MAHLFDTIRALVAKDKYVVGERASERLEELGIMEWQAAAGLSDGDLLSSAPDRDLTQASRSFKFCQMGLNSRRCGRTSARAASQNWLPCTISIENRNEN
jgi:hypothetical protein